MTPSCACRSALHLLLGSLARIAARLQPQGEQQLRRALLARCAAGLVAATSACLGSFALPSDDDAGFWVGSLARLVGCARARAQPGAGSWGCPAPGQGPAAMLPPSGCLPAWVSGRQQGGSWTGPSQSLLT